MGESWKILKKDKELMWFPIITGITTILLTVSFIIPGTLITKKFDEETSQMAFYVLGFLYYLISYFIVIYFNSGLIACAKIRLDGGNPTFGDGMKVARQHIGKIFLWSFVAATVGMILRAIANKQKTLGRIVIALIGTAWNIVTYFIAPVLIFENLGVFESIKKSGSTFKATWGENAIGSISMGIIFLLLGLLGIVPLILMFFILPGKSAGMISFISIATIVGVVLYWLMLSIINTTLKGIFITALYKYATTGEVAEGFSPELIKSSFASKNPPPPPSSWNQPSV